MKATPRLSMIKDLGFRLSTHSIDLPGAIRKVLIAWLFAVLVEYLILPFDVRNLAQLEGLARMSGLRMLVVTLVLTISLLSLSHLKAAVCLERWALVAVFALLALATLWTSFSWAYLVICLLVLGIFVVYGIFGWEHRPELGAEQKKSHWVWPWLTAGLGLAFFAFVSVWTVARVYCMFVSTYDFGLFAQMFHNMKEIGLPMTTLERDAWLSHFDVHVSPIYYLMLPFYMLVPHPTTLQVLQGAVMVSAIIPLWLIGKHHGLSGLQRMLLCAVLIAYPAYCGGVGYDIHENCFLTPLLLWLFYALDKKNAVVTAVSAVLILMVKEDAAVYVAVIALWLILKNVVRLKSADKWTLFAGFALMVGALAWFFAVTSYLASSGDGVMTERYKNFFFDGSTSLITVVKAVLLNPMKALFECVDTEKLKYIGQTMIPLLGLPLLTRRYERFVLLIPYILINLMSDYVYQHDIMFQYNFGSIAFLMYLTAVNLSELKINWLQIGAMALSVVLGFLCIYQEIYPTAKIPVTYSRDYKAYYQMVHQALDTIADDAVVAASGFYTTPLSQREKIYDVHYCSREHLLEAEYVALSQNVYDDYSRFATPGEKDGFERLVNMLERNGYELYHEIENALVIYKKK